MGGEYMQKEAESVISKDCKKEVQWEASILALSAVKSESFCSNSNRFYYCVRYS